MFPNGRPNRRSGSVVASKARSSPGFKAFNLLTNIEVKMSEKNKSFEYEKNQDFNWLTRYLHSFRHEIISEYIKEISDTLERPLKILEIGCGTGKSFQIINSRFSIDYTGIDLTEDYIATANERYMEYDNAKFVAADAALPAFYSPHSADIVIALETLEHIPEHNVVRIVENVCKIVQPKLFIASVPAEIGPIIWIKTLGSKIMGYKRTPYTFSQALNAGFYRLNKLPPHGTSHLGFNWFWLEQTIRHNAPIRETRSLPYRWLPKPFAPTIMFIATPSAD